MGNNWSRYLLDISFASTETRVSYLHDKRRAAKWFVLGVIALIHVRRKLDGVCASITVKRVYARNVQPFLFVNKQIFWNTAESTASIN